MADPCEVINEYGTFSDSISSTRGVELAPSGGTLSEAIEITIGRVYLESATLSDSYEGTRYSVIEESATISEAYTALRDLEMVIADSAVIADTFHVFVTASLTDTATISETLHPSGAAPTIYDFATISDSYTPVRTAQALLADTLAATDRYLPTRTATLTDALTATDALHVSSSATLADSATLSDAYVVGSGEVLADALRVSDRYHPAGTQSGMLSDTLIISDDHRMSRASALSDQGTLSDALHPYVHAGDAIFDTGATLSDAYLPLANAMALVRDEATISDAYTPLAHHVAVINETGWIEDSFIIPGFGAAWTTPTDSFAMSRWETVETDSIAEVDGVLYAASPTGLYRLDQGADDPNFGRIDARIRGGMTDFGAPQLKRLSYFYLGYQTSGTMRVTVGSVPKGVEQSFAYPFPRRIANEPVPGRAQLGRGARSRYWRFTLENVNGADFSVFDQHVDMDSMSRRV